MPALPVPATAAASPGAAAPPSPRPRFSHLLEARLARAPAPPEPPRAALASALRSVEVAQARLDGVLAAARRGQAFTAGQLLALQADAHRFTQTLDVAGKLVEQGVQSVKQAVQAQV